MSSHKHDPAEEHAHGHEHDHHGHGHHHREGHAHHDRGEDDKQGPPLSRKDKLIIRLEHDIRHNSQHAEAGANLAAEAAQIGEEEVARLIRAAAEAATRVNEILQQALSTLKTR